MTEEPTEKFKTKLDTVGIERNGIGKIDFESLIAKAQNDYANSDTLKLTTNEPRYVASIIRESLEAKGYLK